MTRDEVVQMLYLIGMFDLGVLCVAFVYGMGALSLVSGGILISLLCFGGALEANEKR